MEQTRPHVDVVELTLAVLRWLTDARTARALIVLLLALTAFLLFAVLTSLREIQRSYKPSCTMSNPCFVQTDR